jgi:hypothetical protein
MLRLKTPPAYSGSHQVQAHSVTFTHLIRFIRQVSRIFQNGFVNLTLIVLPQSPCALTAFDELTLTFQSLSEVDAGADAIICSGESLQLSGQALEFESLEWSSNGSGTFSNQIYSILFTTPSTGDITAGSVNINPYGTAIITM